MSFWRYLQDRRGDLLEYALLHLEVVLIAIGIATVIGVGLGIAVAGHRRSRAVMLGITGALLTVPSFALFGLLIPLFAAISPDLGLGLAPTLTALILYAIFPILRNTVTGLEEVPAEVVDAGRGMGLSGARLMWLVRLPIAWPVIVNGVRVSTIMTIGIAAIAAAVDGPGLGQPIFDGLNRSGGANALNDTLAGLLGLAALALLLDVVFLALTWLTTPRGIRG